MAVKDGNTVRVHYTGTFSDGEVFDSSREREPLEFTIGDGSLIPGFEDALLGHNAGDRFTVTIPADEAYGEHLEELLMEVPVSADRAFVLLPCPRRDRAPHRRRLCVLGRPRAYDDHPRERVPAR